MMKEIKKIVIIGAGITGLLSGLEFSKKGYDVTILEKNNFIGGVATSIISNGYSMDIGPHYVTLQNGSEITKNIINIINENNLVKLPENIRRSRKAYFYSKLWDEFPTINQFISNMNKKNLLQIIFEICLNKLKNNFKNNPKNSKEYLISNYGKFLYKNWFVPYYKNLFYDEIPSIELVKEKFVPINFNKILKNINLNSKKMKSKESVSNGFFDCYFKNGMITLIKSIEKEILKNNGIIETGANIKKIEHETKKIVYEKDSKIIEINSDVIIYALPLNTTKRWLNIEDSKKENQIKTLNSIMVFLFIDTEKLFDRWIIDIYDNDLIFWRISQQSFLSNTVTPAKKTLVNVEIRTKENSDVWNLNDENIFKNVINDLKKIKIIGNEKIEGYKILRLKNIYPLNPNEIYDNSMKNLVNSYDNEYVAGIESNSDTFFTENNLESKNNTIRPGGILIEMMNAKNLVKKIIKK